ncbi:MAG: DUF2029 domain-containing protein [Clostridiales bacterium]|nr:DUF2029 domain-containing protein [Clostridiales bacterium]
MPFEVIRCYIAIVACSVITLLLAAMMIFKNFLPKIKNILIKKEKIFVKLILLFGLVGYVITVFGYFGVIKYVRDFDLFLMWSRILIDDGLKGFMSEYPAGGLYLLALLQHILRLFKVADNYIITTVFMKLPSIIATLATSYFAYRWSKQKFSDYTPLLIMMIIAFNPAFLINASIWGQIDMILILIVVLTFYLLKKERIVLSIIFYTLGCLFKAQMIFFAPIFGMFIVIPFFNKGTRKKSLQSLTVGVVISIILFTLATLPFKNAITDIWIIDFFKHISSEHPVNTASALNLFGLHGGSFKLDTNQFLFLNYRIWGYIFIGLSCGFCAYLSVKNYKHRQVFLLSAFCMAAIYTLGVSMHERYILPVIALLAVSYIYQKDKESIILIVLYTTTATVNQCMIIFDLFGGQTRFFRLFSGINVAIFIFFVFYIIKKIVLRYPKENQETLETNKISS